MQTTQSSSSTFFRAVVMIGFLGIIFYAALSGNALPDAVRKQIEKYLPQALQSHKAAGPELANHSRGANATSEAPRFDGSSAGKTAAGAEAAPPMTLDIPSAPRKLATDGSSAMLPGASTEPSPMTPGKSIPSPVVPVNYQSPLDATAAAIPGQTPGAADPFSQMQDRLKQLGATYYLLETWGNQQQLYRFYCQMAVGGTTNYTRCFEATNADPLQAMSDVLKQVEAWRGGGAPTR